VATTVTALTAARTTSASAPTTIAITIATTAGTSLTRTFRTRGTRLYRCHDSIHTVEVRLIIGIEIRAAFDYCRGCALWRQRHLARRRKIRCLARWFWKRSPTHLGALLFQNRLPGQLDAVAFDGQNLHQHLVAFFQFIANILDSVFGDFADVQQTVQAGQNFDERSEIRQAADLPEIGLPHLGRRR
jgi:hypothetical protein